MYNKIIKCLFFLLSSGISFSQNIEFPELEGFKTTTDYPVYERNNLWDFINGAADNYLALGFIDLHVAEYKKGKESIKLEIYRHEDHTLAFGIYASERSPSFKYINVGSQGYKIEGSINFFKGDFYVKIRTYSEKEKTLYATELLAQKVAEILPGETEMPPPLLQFPEIGKKPYEETYINENVLGYSFFSKAFKAVYESDNTKFEIFLMNLNSSQNALNIVAEYLKSSGIYEDVSRDNKFVVSDKYNGTIFLFWENNSIVIISGLAINQRDIADKYFQEIVK